MGAAAAPLPDPVVGGDTGAGAGEGVGGPGGGGASGGTGGGGGGGAAPRTVTSFDVLLSLPLSVCTCNVTEWTPGAMNVNTTACPTASKPPSPLKSQLSRTIGRESDDADVNVTACPTVGTTGL